ncbi:MAG: prepilin-type N-terminal cleavage/methylation domain-containing protein [Pirellulaceae bacterium]|nr:prepilin-type N-terminal cleavage/methylation domain-containing protein [Pirellulaceae bacterium]
MIHRKNHGISLLELLAAITILAIIAAVVVPRFGDNAKTAKKRACLVNKGNIEVQTQLWFRTKGSWPATGLSDIGINRSFFPEGLPTCPVDGSAYQLDAATHRVTGHSH